MENEEKLTQEILPKEVSQILMLNKVLIGVLNNPFKYDLDKFIVFDETENTLTLSDKFLEFLASALK